MSEMVERVARAICEHDNNCHPVSPPRSLALEREMASARGEHYRNYARAAIAAMSSPTVAMHSRGDQTFNHLAYEPHPGEISGCVPVWRAMIDEALK